MIAILGAEHMNVADWIALWTSLAVLLGVFVALMAVVSQIRIVRLQMTAQQFSVYTKRYQEILMGLPEVVFAEPCQLSDMPDRDDLVSTIRMYFDLCFEEWYMNSRGFIDHETWCLWERGMKTACSRTIFRQAWEVVSEDTDFGSDFEAFIDGLIHSDDG